MGQTTVKGVISDKDGMPIPGATVYPQTSPQNGTITQGDGSYSLSVPAGETHIKVTFIGKQDQLVEIGGRSVVDVTLADEDVNVEEVIVTGYAVKGKNSLTGSTIQVSGDDIRNVPVVSVDQALQGKVAGMTISTSSGTPGAVQDIRIRGVGSLTAGNDPLIVLDGVPIINSDMSASDARSSLSALAAINSADIESITVLKDASATSAYGARGSNGVIVITTKRGKAGKTAFNLTTSYGFQNKATEGRKALTGAQREELYYEALANQYGVANGFDETTAYDWATTALATNTNFKALVAWKAAGSPENSWDDAMSNNDAPVFNMNFSATGGDQTSSFYSSIGYNKTEAIVLGSEFSRLNGSLNYKKDLTKTVKFNTSNSVSNTNQDGLILEQGGYFANPLLAKFFMSPWISPYDADGEPNLATNGPHNYLYLKDHNQTYNKLTRFINNSSVEWEIIDNLKLKSLVSFDFNLANYKNYVNRNYGDGANPGGYSESQVAQNANMVTQNSLAYTIQKGEHYISALALLEYQKNKYSYTYGYGEDFIADGLTNVNSAGANKDADSYFEDWMNASYLGMINYEYSNKYILDFTFRREGSSRFAPDKRFGSFWSTGAAWNIIKEDFMQNISFLSNLRLRGSYGVSGNSAISLNSYQALLAFDVNYNGTGAVYPSGYGNNNLSWEKNKTFDAGIDFGFLGERITGSVAYFNKYTFDLLQQVPLSRTSGHSSIYMNVGELSNSGIELMLDFSIIKSTDFNLSASFNFATLTNEVKKLAKDGEGNPINIETATRKIEEGHPIYEWRMRSYAGVNPDNGKPLWYLKEGSDETTEVYNDAALIYQGYSAIPTYSGGGAIHVDYKGIYLDANVYFAGGHKVYEDWAAYTHHAGTRTIASYNGVAELMNRWQKPGDITDVPIMLYDATANSAALTSSRFLYDGTFLRLKDLVLGYNIPSEWLAKAKFQTASVFVRGTNIYTWVKDKNLKYDPEVRADGFTRLTNPPIKSITFGVNLNF